MINRYLRERGDANIKTNADLIAKATFYDDPNFPNRRAAREQAERATALDTSARMHTRFALQTLLLQLHGGAEARRARGADVHRAAEEAAVTARAAKQRPHADRLVHVRAAGIPGRSTCRLVSRRPCGTGNASATRHGSSAQSGEAARWRGLHRPTVR